MKKCVLIYNPKSGKKERKKYLPKMKEIIEEKGYSCDIFLQNIMVTLQKLCHL